MIANLLPWRSQQRRCHITYCLSLWLAGLSLLTLTTLRPYQQGQQHIQSLNQHILTLQQQLLAQKARNSHKTASKKPPTFNHANHLVALLLLLEHHSPNLQITQLESHPPHWQLQGQSHDWPSIQALMHALTTQTYQPTLSLHAKTNQLHFLLRGHWPLQPPPSPIQEIDHG